MNPSDLKKLLTAIRDGAIAVDEGMERLRTLPFEDVGVALIDHHRELRQGAAEIILGESKSTDQLLTIVEKMAERGSNILVTRLGREKAETLLALHPAGNYDADGRTFTLVQRPVEIVGRGKIVVVCAGTSDIPVTREATESAAARTADPQCSTKTAPPCWMPLIFRESAGTSCGFLARVERALIWLKPGK